MTALLFISEWHWISAASLIILCIYFVVSLAQSAKYASVPISPRVSSRNLLKLVDRTMELAEGSLASSTSLRLSGRRERWYMERLGQWMATVIPILLIVLHMTGNLESVVQSQSTETLEPTSYLALITLSEPVTGGRLQRIGDIKRGLLESCDLLFFCGNPTKPTAALIEKKHCTPMWLMRHPDNSLAVYKIASEFSSPSIATVDACRLGARITEGYLLRRLWIKEWGWWERMKTYWSGSSKAKLHERERLDLRFAFSNNRLAVYIDVKENEKKKGWGKRKDSDGAPSLLDIYAEKYRFKKSKDTTKSG
jgi:hypothetical protein